MTHWCSTVLFRNTVQSFPHRYTKSRTTNPVPSLTYLKLLGGTLSVREAISYTPFGSDTPVTEKITAIRRYSGEKFDTLDAAEAGDVCAVLGLTKTYAGMGIGTALQAEEPVIEPVLHYRLCLPQEVDPQAFYPKLLELEEEEPETPPALERAVPRDPCAADG